MQDKGKEELDGELKNLYHEKDQLEDQIRMLDKEKIEKLQNLNEELENQVVLLDKEKIKITKERDNLLRKIKHFKSKRWINALKMIIALSFVDLIIIPLIVFTLHIPSEWLLISLGIITFFGILIITNYMSETAPFDTGEVRKALTGSFIIVYFAFISLVTMGNVNALALEPIKTIATNFTWLVAVIVIFYFGSRAVEEFVKNYK